MKTSTIIIWTGVVAAISVAAYLYLKPVVGQKQTSLPASLTPPTNWTRSQMQTYILTDPAYKSLTNNDLSLLTDAKILSTFQAAWMDLH